MKEKNSDDREESKQEHKNLKTPNEKRNSPGRCFK